MGPDGMEPRVLRELEDMISRTLMIIFERSWMSGKVPEDWKKANVISVFKKGKKEDLELQTCQPRVNSWKGGEAPHSGGHFHPHGGQEGDQEYSAWIH
ncbi:hypothetical protein BTVI_04117 [Pitangus sulphuratus]|nr:hypothetical protein BTVI_04117 [Pitangus sulphuratus]